MHSEYEYYIPIYSSTEDYAACNNISPAGLTRLLFFDLDNTLYPRSSGVGRYMSTRISLFLTTHLCLPAPEAAIIAARFNTDYGLAIKGCIEHFSVDPRHYDAFVDGGLPLEQVLQKMGTDERDDVLRGADARRWVFTNAGKLHAERVLGILGVRGLFEGIVCCDYAEPHFPAKPGRVAFSRALDVTGYNIRDKVYFVDDSERNVQAAIEAGWSAVLIDEDFDPELPKETKSMRRIASLLELPLVFPEIYKHRGTQ